MNPQEILIRFAMIASLNEQEAAPWLSICSEAADEVRRLLRDSSLEQENSTRLNAAAAALAFYRYTVYRASGEGMNNFSAGDIKITVDKKTTVDMAFRVWMDAKRSIFDLINDDNFMVEKVSII